MNRKWWIAGAVSVVAIVVVGTGAVMAQTATPGTGSPTFLDRVAQKLGIETPKLQDAVKSAANDQIDAEVQNGTLTQQQADAMKKRIDSGVDSGKGLGGPFEGRGGPKGGFGPGLWFGAGPGMGADANAIAGFLGIDATQLKTELQGDGATLATVAQAHGKSRDDLKGFLTDQSKTRLDKAVADGNLTQKQADAIQSGLTSHLDDMIDHSGGLGGGRGRGGRHMMPKGPMTPGAPTTPGTGSTTPGHTTSFDESIS